MSATLLSNTALDRYKEFIHVCSDPNLEPVKVFVPLTPLQISELHLIRELSMDLQKKKEEDMRKAAEAAAEAVKVQEEEKPSNDNVEEKTEEESQE